MHQLKRIILVAFLVIGVVAPQAAAQVDSRQHVSVDVIPGKRQVAAGGDLPIAVVFEMDPGWHIWAHDGAKLPEGLTDWEFAINTVVEVTSESEALQPHTGFLAWPEVHGVEADLGDGPTEYAVFEGRAIAYIPVTVAEDATPGEVSLTLTLTYQTCDDSTCLAPVMGEEHKLTFEIVPPAEAGETTLDQSVFGGFPVDVWQKIRGGERAPEIVSFDLFGFDFDIDVSGTGGFILLLIVAAIGGFLLNLTPCVLPVIPIKIMGLSQSAGNRMKTFGLGVAMAAGVVGFWVGLGVLIAGVAAFTATNQLFQYPAFTITVGVIIALMAIGMCGVFSLRLPQNVYMVTPKHDTVLGSFAFGIMTAVLSTPCTAPFMGAAAAWAALQPPSVVLITFGMIGAGMAFPYLVLSAFPKLIERMPRTGPASELIKQVMGLLMLAAAAYFIGVGLSGLLVSPPDPPSRLYWWAVFAFLAVAGVWMAWRTFQITKSSGKRLVFGGLGAVIAVLAVVFAVRFTDKGPINWIYYTPERFAQARAEGNVIVVEFTAEWCLNCKALEESVLRSRPVVELFEREGVVPMKVDLTGNNDLGNAMLKNVDRLTIPLLVIFAPDGTEVFKGDFYTVQQVVDAVNEAQGAERVATRD